MCIRDRLDELLDQVEQMPLPEDHEVVQALGSYCLHEPLRVRVAVRTLRWDRRALHAAGFEKRRPCLREQRVSVVDQVACVAQESVRRIKQIPGNLLHPCPIWRNTDPCNMHGTGLHLYDKVDHIANRTEHT